MHRCIDTSVNKSLVFFVKILQMELHRELALDNRMSYFMKMDGKYTNYMWGVGVPSGLVVDGYFYIKYGKNVKAEVFPLRPGGINPIAIMKRMRYMEDVNSVYYPAQMAIVHDSIFEKGYYLGPIFLSELILGKIALPDITKKLKEARNYDKNLANMYRATYIAITGEPYMGQV